MPNSKNILAMCYFLAECSGNFINSILYLAEKQQPNYNTVFLFPIENIAFLQIVFPEKQSVFRQIS